MLSRRHGVAAFALAAGVTVLLSGPPWAAADEPTTVDVRFFEAKVRPILADHCLKCHGEAKQRGGLRLDSRAAVLAGGGRGAAVVPGRPSESILLQAVGHETDLKMPPTKKLAWQQIADLTRWVQIGAPWTAGEKVTASGTLQGPFQITAKDRAHWSFQPLRRPPVPAVRELGVARNPIDAFIRVGLEASGLAPSAPAPPVELVRRLYYDLTGLPPTPEEVDAFLADASPTAYESLVDRLLSSPRYGEKWGRHWLDLVRYADTNSYERDNPKPNAWRYRDYVIRSLNDDKPYARFVREQMAGDELADGGADGLVATGYYRLGIWDDEPSDPEQARYDDLDDIVATTSQVFLGLTVDCARCHDHKIDPIPQKDYYRLLAFFHSITRFRNGGPTDEALLFAGPQERSAYERRERELEEQRNRTQASLRAIEEELRVRLAGSGGERARAQDLDELEYRYYRDTWNRLPDFAALKPESAGKLPRQLFDLGPRSRDEAFGFVFEGTLLVPEAGHYTFYLDSDDGSRLTIAGRTVIEYDGIHGLGHEKHATLPLPAGRVPIKLEYFQNQFGLGLSVAWSGPGFGRRNLSASDQSRPLAENIAHLIRSEGPRLLGQTRVEEYQRLQADLVRVKKQRVPADKALCVSEVGRQPLETFVLVRGNPHVKGERVEPAFPEVLGGSSPAVTPPTDGGKTAGRRLALADWIAAPDNPLTARVMANRIWQYHFGRGLVRSPNNLGTQGDPPTHPELLDWLAAELIEQAWRLKPLHRLIVTSEAYRMSSRGNPSSLAADPANDRLWRFDMRRLSAEEVRDSLLAVTGVLNPKMYGPGVYPEIPKAVMAGQSKPGDGWGKSPRAEQDRRSVYVHVKRSLLVPILESFDVAETDRPNPVRFSTTQPTQALAMLNGPFLNQQAGVFAARLRREAGPSVEGQVRRALRLVTLRPARESEVRRALELITGLEVEDGLTADAALKAFSLLALNLNEFIYLD
jgi:hypothetical protein